MSNSSRIQTLALTSGLLTSLVATLAPSLVFAHPGHQHVASSATHHGMEALLVVLAAVAFAWSLRRAGVWGASRN